MIITITVQLDDTRDIRAGMSPNVGLLQTHRTPDGSHILIWEPPRTVRPDNPATDKYKAALEKQKNKSKLRRV